MTRGSHYSRESCIQKAGRSLFAVSKWQCAMREKGCEGPTLWKSDRKISHHYFRRCRKGLRQGQLCSASGEQRGGFEIASTCTDKNDLQGVDLNLLKVTQDGHTGNTLVFCLIFNIDLPNEKSHRVLLPDMAIRLQDSMSSYRPIVLKKRLFFLKRFGKNQKSLFFEKKTRFFWKSWKNSSRVTHNVKLLQNWCVVLRLDSSLFSFQLYFRIKLKNVYTFRYKEPGVE